MAATLRTKRYRKKRVNNLLRAAICITVLAVLVLVTQIFTGFLDRLLPSSGGKRHPDASPGSFGIAAKGALGDFPDFRLTALASLVGASAAGSMLPVGIFTDNQQFPDPFPAERKNIPVVF